MLYSTVYDKAITCLAVNSHLGISQWTKLYNVNRGQTIQMDESSIKLKIVRVKILQLS